MRNIEDMVRKTIEDQQTQDNVRFETEGRETILLAEKYQLMIKTEGWQKVESFIKDRISSLSRTGDYGMGTIFFANDEKQFFRIQGEALGLASVLTSIYGVIESAKEIKEELEEK